MKIIAKSHHRNGICGAPFDVYIIQEEDKTQKVCIDFGDDAFAVLDIAKLADGDIAFGSNSWRGDHYSDSVRKAGKKVELDATPYSVFIRYGLGKERA